MEKHMASYLLEEPTPTPFDFQATTHAHGWLALRPFAWHPENGQLTRTHRLRSGRVVHLRLQDDDARPAVQAHVESAEGLDRDDEQEIRQAVRRMLRLDEDLAEFHRLYDQMNGRAQRLKPGAGRLLRCPSLFEDVVYTLCTTNTTWAGTQRMVERLVEVLGDPLPGQPERRAFPTPEAIAAAGPDSLKAETRLGYRSGYVWALAGRVARGELDLSALEDPTRPGDEVWQELLQIKGVGDYAAATILMLLGRYDHLAIDTEMRSFVSKKYCQGQPASDVQIRAIYAPWGRWQYLAYWFDQPAPQA
jgi:3-methyladenine DNA glycosylase/8-oxoguanine DNA glycosylase